MVTSLFLKKTENEKKYTSEKALVNPYTQTITWLHACFWGVFLYSFIQSLN